METGEQGAQVPLLRTLTGQGSEDRVVVGETGLRKKSCAREAGEKNPKAGESLWPESSGCRPPPAAAGEDGQFPTPTHTPRPDWSISILLEKPYGGGGGVPRPFPARVLIPVGEGRACLMRRGN